MWSFKAARRLLILGLILACSGLFLPSGAEVGTRGGRLVVAQVGGPRGFNSLLARDQETVTIGDLIMVSLVTINRRSQQVEPALAEQWTFSQDGRVLTLRLRKDVRFSDGHPFTADDVLFTFTVALDDKVPASVGHTLTLDGKKPVVDKVDAYTVRITFPQPLGAAERLLDGIPILPRHILEPPYKKGTLATAWNLSVSPAQVVGLGPFRLKHYVPGQRTVVERNPFYWKRDAQGHPLPYLDEVVFEVIPDKNTQQLKFQQGQLDVLKPLTGEEVATLREPERKGTVKIYDVGPGLVNDLLWFNQNDAKNPRTGQPWLAPYRRHWFETTAFRQAVSYAINREAITRVVFGGYASPSWGPITPGNRIWYNDRIPRYPYDPEKARALLQGAGFTHRKDQLYDRAGHPVEFVLSTNAGNVIRQKMSAMIQQDLAALGMKVTLTPVETRTLLSKIEETYDYEACLLAIASGDIDPSAEMRVLLSRGSGHWWHPRQAQPATAWEARIDALMSEQLHTLDFARRKQLFDEVQAIMAEQQAFVYLAARHTVVAAKANLGNVKPAILTDFILWNSEELFWKK